MAPTLFCRGVQKILGFEPKYLGLYCNSFFFSLTLFTSLNIINNITNSNNSRPKWIDDRQTFNRPCTASRPRPRTPRTPCADGSGRANSTCPTSWKWPPRPHGSAPKPAVPTFIPTDMRHWASNRPSTTRSILRCTTATPGGVILCSSPRSVSSTPRVSRASPPSKASSTTTGTT